jgi:DNA-binding TFAR19-related protein (PDSD5 family)
MHPISHTDQLVLLLRQKLQERAKTSPKSRAGKVTDASTSEPVTPQGIQALTQVEEADERVLRRALVQNLLADQLGPELLNDAQFQQIVTRVTDTIEDDPTTARLLTRVLSDIRS